MRLFPPGAPLSPSGCVVMARCGRRGRIVRRPPRGTCTWCGAAVSPPRRTWCGFECVEAFRMTQPPTLVAFVRRRDAGKPCEVCGGDRGIVGCGLMSIDEVDHRVPIAEGGHPFDPANLRVIHAGCHRRITAELHERLRARVAA